MPSKKAPDEVFLHVPIKKSLAEDLKKEASAAGLSMRGAVEIAVASWVGAHRYQGDRMKA